jgi:carbon monoxide dehydrogenase subunit G
MTTNVEKSVTVDAPISVVYGQWTRFEDFPQFMGGIQQVQQLTDDRLHWVAEIAGVKREWDAKILEQIPDEKIAWAATEGATNAGSVRFSPVGAGSTLVTLSLEYEPEGLVEKAGDQLKIVQRQTESDLEKFKTLMESGEGGSAGWRGSVNEGAGVDRPGVEHAASSQGDSGKAGISGKAVAAGAAVVGAAAVAAAASKKSGDTDTDTDTDIGTVQPVAVEPVDVEPVLTEPALAEPVVTTDTYPVADEPAPFAVDGGDDHPRTV